LAPIEGGVIVWGYPFEDKEPEPTLELAGVDGEPLLGRRKRPARNNTWVFSGSYLAARWVALVAVFVCLKNVEQAKLGSCRKLLSLLRSGSAQPD
jgi:hypothetical protein